MKKYLFLMLLALPMVCLFTACGGDGDDDANAPQNTVVVVKEDGTTSNGSIFSAIDDKNFYLDYIKYTLEESHLTVSGYDKLGFKGVAKIVPKITYKGNTYEVLSIKGYSEEGPGAFTKCNILTSIVIPNSVTLIENDAFYKCSNLTSVIIGDGVKTIDSDAFRDCKSLTSVTIGNSVTSIGSRAFYECTGLTSITIPNSVKSIGWDAFKGCI